MSNTKGSCYILVSKITSINEQTDEQHGSEGHLFSEQT